MGWENAEWLIIIVAIICFTILTLPVTIGVSRLIFREKNGRKASEELNTSITYSVGGDNRKITVGNGEPKQQS